MLALVALTFRFLLGDEDVDLTGFSDLPYTILALLQAFWPMILIGALIGIVVIPILGPWASKWLKGLS